MPRSLPSLRTLATVVQTHIDDLYDRYLHLTARQRLLLHLLLLFNLLLLLAVLLIGPETIFHQTASLALWFSHQPFGIPLLVAIVVLVSFPPLFGYGTAITLCGLGWGVQAPETSDHPAMNGSLLKGWALASSACLIGASVSFLALRSLIRRNANGKLISSVLQDQRFRAMKEAVSRKGTKMVVLIRFCPFPFCYSNLFFSSLDTVTYPQFLFATALITPKLFLHVFIGARMFELMDREQRAKLDGWGKALNILYIVLGSAVGAFTGWLVWQETQKILDQLPSTTPSLSTSQSGEGARRTPTRPDDRNFVVEFDAERASSGAYDSDEEDERGLRTDGEEDVERRLLAHPEGHQQRQEEDRRSGGRLPISDGGVEPFAIGGEEEEVEQEGRDRGS